jgi:hypothetical protein
VTGRGPIEGRDYEVVADGATVWVNASDGMCIGRFGARGVDVHRSAAEQAAGAPQCLDCIHGLAPAEAWSRFVESMARHHGVAIGSEWTPAFVATAAAHAVEDPGRPPSASDHRSPGN